MKDRMKSELLIFIQYFFIAVISLLCAEITMFLIISGSDVGEINMAGYFSKNLDGRFVWMCIFFLIIGILRIIAVLATSGDEKQKTNEHDRS